MDVIYCFLADSEKCLEETNKEDQPVPVLQSTIKLNYGIAITTDKVIISVANSYAA